MRGETQVFAAPAWPMRSNPPVIIARKISFLHRSWPAEGLVIAAIVNVIWMGFLGYWFFKLFAPAFF
jgi:hypothetical protein